MKTNTILIIALILFFSACESDDDNKKRTKAEHYECSVIIEQGTKLMLYDKNYTAVDSISFNERATLTGSVEKAAAVRQIAGVEIGDIIYSCKIEGLNKDFEKSGRIDELLLKFKDLNLVWIESGEYKSNFFFGDIKVSGDIGNNYSVKLSGGTTKYIFGQSDYTKSIQIIGTINFDEIK